VVREAGAPAGPLPALPQPAVLAQLPEFSARAELGEFRSTFQALEDEYARLQAEESLPQKNPPPAGAASTPARPEAFRT